METVGIIPRHYQLRGVDFLISSPGAILGDKQGVGKTVQAILAAIMVEARRVLVVVPSPTLMKPQWIGEILRVEGALGAGQGVVDYPFPKLPRITFAGRAYYLAHFQQFQERGPNVREVYNFLKKQRWDVIIVDEAHHLQNRKSQQSRNIKKLKAAYKWGLTATPLTERLPTLWSLLNWVAPKVFGFRQGVTYKRFLTHFAEIETDFWGYSRIVGVKEAMLPVLHDLVKPYLLVRTLEDVGLELPPLTITDVPLEMEEAQTKFYREVQRRVIVGLESDDLLDFEDVSPLVIMSRLARMTREHQAASDPTVFSIYLGKSNVKMDWVKDYLENGGEPALIVTSFVHTKDRILDVIGGDSGFVVGTYKALAEGLNLQHLRVAIAVDPPQGGSRTEWEQFTGRLHRMGQTRPVQIYRLSALGTVDEHLWGLVDEKQGIATTVTNWLRGLKEVVSNERQPI